MSRVQLSLSRRRWILAAIWILLLAAAFTIDRTVAQWVLGHRPLDHAHIDKLARRIIRLPGFYPFTMLIAVLLGLWHLRRWAGAVALAVSGAGVGAIGWTVKWIVGRQRPVIRIAPFDFHPFPHGLAGIFFQKALCFPSGDTILAFASAASLAVLLPRGRWWFYAWAALVAAERVLENAHYVSDVVAAAGIGALLGDLVTRWILSGFSGGSSRADYRSAFETPAGPRLRGG